MKNIKLYFFSALYFIACIVSVNFILVENREAQLYTKPFVSIFLFLLYTSSVKKTNKLYVLMFPLILASHCFIIYIESYFNTCLYIYMLISILSIILIYKKMLFKKSLFNIFTFALPFFMAFTTIFTLIKKNLGPFEIVSTFIFGIVICINGSIVLLNYSQQQEIDNYLIFIGVFTIIAADASAALYQYANKGIIFYQLLVVFDYLGQYAVCRGLILKQKTENKVFRSFNKMP